MDWLGAIPCTHTNTSTALAIELAPTHAPPLHPHPTLPLDPHPGNVSVDGEGRLLYYDYGMMGSIPGSVRDSLLDVFYGIYRCVHSGHSVHSLHSSQAWLAALPLRELPTRGKP